MQEQITQLKADVGELTSQKTTLLEENRRFRESKDRLVQEQNRLNLRTELAETRYFWLSLFTRVNSNSDRLGIFRELVDSILDQVPENDFKIDKGLANLIVSNLRMIKRKCQDLSQVK